MADVEMQKLDLLTQNLAEVYAVYHDWGNAIQAQILQIEGEAAPDDYDRLSRWWLRRQYDIALQQRYFQEHTLANVNSSVVEPEPGKRQANAEELRWLELNLPSQFQPFEGLVFPLSANQNAFRPDRKNEGHQNTTESSGKKQFISMPDRLGLSSRLSLYDAQRQFVVGEPAETQISYRPIMVGEKIVGYLGLKPVLDQEDALSINFFSKQTRYLLLVYVLSILASLVAALLLATYFKKPIQRLLNATRELTQGNYQHQVTIKRNDELGDLAAQLNQLAIILDQHEQSRRQWVADTSHELKTPITILKGQIQGMLLEVGGYKDRDRYLKRSFEVANSMENMVQEILYVSKIRTSGFELKLIDIPLHQLVENVIKEQEDMAIDRGLQFHIRIEESTWIRADEALFTKVISNVVGNAIKYTNEDGNIWVGVYKRGEEIIFWIENETESIDEKEIPKLCDAFYRIDKSRNKRTGGSGLGLYITKMILEQHQFPYCIENTEKGIKVEIRCYEPTRRLL